MWSLYKEPFSDLNCGAIVLLKSEYLEAWENEYQVVPWKGAFRITQVETEVDKGSSHYMGTPTHWDSGKKAMEPFCDMVFEFDPKDIMRKK